MAIPSEKLIFIVGLWRSGTSLLHLMLNGHPQTAIMYEAEPFGLWPCRADSIWPDDWPQRLDFFNQAITRHRLDDIAFPKKISGREGLLTLFRAFAGSCGKQVKIIGGKSPTYHKWLPQIARIFPEANFIIIWRDPLECCRSAREAGATNRFFAQPGMSTRILFGAERLARGVEHLRREGRRVHEIVYHELVDTPEAELRRICEFLEIQFDSGMLDLKAADFTILPPGKHHERARSGQLKRKIAYQELLSPAFVAKGWRYGAFWRERYAHLGFARALQPGFDALKPGKIGRLVDQSGYLIWRGIDSVKRQIFRRIPLSWWGGFRSKNFAFGFNSKSNPNEVLRKTTRQS
jgi:hypothetical protein